LTICPSCGAKVQQDLCAGCAFCGARAIGPPLARPEHQLTSYGRAVLTLVAGVVMTLVFLVSVATTLIQSKKFSIQFGTIVTVGEVVAWSLKWIALPAAIVVFWSSARMIQSIKLQPARFSGLRMARGGFVSAIVTTITVATLIGVTLPERYRRHQWAVEAETNARIYTVNRALLEFKERYGTYPSALDDLNKLPDPYGVIAEAVRNTDPAGYQPSSPPLAAASTKVKTLPLRGGALRAANDETTTDHAVSFTNYDLRLAGEDKIMFTSDDLIVRDGVIMSVADLPRPTAASKSRKP